MAEFKAANPDHKGIHKVIETPNGPRVHTLSTDIDVLVVEPTATGKARILHREEVKSGTRDQASKAKAQLEHGRTRLEEAADGNKVVRLYENGVDITGQIDLASVRGSTQATRGPLGKGFDDSLGVKAADLERLFKELIKLEVSLRSSGGG